MKNSPLIKKILLAGFVMLGFIYIFGFFAKSSRKIEFKLTDKKIDLSQFQAQTNVPDFQIEEKTYLKEIPKVSEKTDQKIRQKIDLNESKNLRISVPEIATKPLSLGNIGINSVRQRTVLDYLKSYKTDFVIDDNFFANLLEQIKIKNNDYFVKLNKTIEEGIKRLNNSKPPPELQEFVTLKINFYRHLQNFINVLKQNEIKNLIELHSRIEFRRLSETTNQLKLLGENLIIFLKHKN